MEIGNTGQIVGYTRMAGGHLRATLWENGKPAPLPNLPSGLESRANGPNDAGVIVSEAVPAVGTWSAVSWGAPAAATFVQSGQADVPAASGVRATTLAVRQLPRLAQTLDTTLRDCDVHPLIVVFPELLWM